jgi:hypothetical protein
MVGTTLKVRNVYAGKEALLRDASNFMSNGKAVFCEDSEHKQCDDENGWKSSMMQTAFS